MTDEQERQIIACCLRELADLLDSADLKHQEWSDGTSTFDPRWTLEGIVARLRERCAELEAGRQWRELAKLCKQPAQPGEEK